MLKLRLSPKLASLPVLVLPVLALAVLGTAGCANLNKIKDAQVIANMRTVRQAVEDYSYPHR